MKSEISIIPFFFKHICVSHSSEDSSGSTIPSSNYPEPKCQAHNFTMIWLKLKIVNYTCLSRHCEHTNLNKNRQSGLALILVVNNRFTKIQIAATFLIFRQCLHKISTLHLFYVAQPVQLKQLQQSIIAFTAACRSFETVRSSSLPASDLENYYYIIARNILLSFIFEKLNLRKVDFLNDNR